MTRRTFLGGAAAGAALLTLPSRPAAAAGSSNSALPDGVWLGPELWGNRLQDWVHRAGRIECVAPNAQQRRVRTVSWLTRQVDDAPFQLRVRTGTLQAGAGLSGFLIGTGVPGEDSRRRALVGTASGVGGGLIAGFEADGVARFREHTDEQDQFAFAPLPSVASAAASKRDLSEDVTLELSATPGPGSTTRLLLNVFDTRTETLLTSAETEVATERVRGGVALVGSALSGSQALYWFADPKGGGAGLSEHADRSLGPIVGTLFSVSGSVLKLSAQFMPVNVRAISTAGLEIKDGRGWRRVATEPIGAGYTAVFRVTGWDSSRSRPFRVVAADGSTYDGQIPAEPTGALRVASINCIKAAQRRLDAASEHVPLLAGSQPLDLYSSKNLWFPHEQLASGLAAQHADLLVAHGDQLYQNSPTVADNSQAPELDWLYKYLPWLWSFRELTRNTPTIVLVDDHDIYQGNVWGAGGAPAPEGDQNQGGYVKDPAWVNTIQRVSCGHNPDPYDPRPVGQGIEVYYGSFSYGGVSFAILEDRKFKTGPDGSDAQSLPEDQLVLLGDRQEEFLRAWRDQHPGQPKIVLTQTAWACVQTDESGRPNADRDSNGWPRPARDRALRLVRDAHAIMLSGDQHLGSLIRHGIDDLADGPIQFTAPGGSTSFQRWFEPATPLPNASDTPNTGDWVDGFGNRFRALALINPSFTQAAYRQAYPSGSDFGDRALKNEGYGVVQVDHSRQEIRLECWRWDADVTAGQQYPGFPVTYAYNDL